jgi:hypothetical protein
MYTESNREIIAQIAAKHNFTFDDMVNQSRRSIYRQARRECAQHLRSIGLSYPQIGTLMHREWQSIMALCKGPGTGYGKTCVKCPTELNQRNQTGYCRKCFSKYSTHSRKPLQSWIDPRTSWCPPELLSEYKWLVKVKSIPSAEARLAIENHAAKLAA